MTAFLYGVFLQWKLNMRNKEIVVVYYIVPLVFFLFMGSVFTSIMPDAHQTLIQSMTIFGVTMGGVIGAPAPLIEMLSSGMKKSYRVGQVPLWSIVLGHFLSGCIHLFVMSMCIFIVAPILFNAILPNSLFNYFLSLIFTIVISLGIGTAFGLYVNKSSQVGMITQIIFLPSVMLSGIMFPVNLLPQFLQMIGKVIPASWCYSAMISSNDFNNFILLTLIVIIIMFICLWKLKRIYKED